MQGIFKPAVCALPLSIRTGKGSPYDDHFRDDRLAYSYRGTDPRHRDNVGLRECLRQGIPLVYLHAVSKGQYLVVAPVRIVQDEPQALRFWVQAESEQIELATPMLSGSLGGADIIDDARRAYSTRLVRQRLHQRGFRERVLAAYRDRCAMCSLRHRELLDAAHIKPDTAGGDPQVSNGLSLCKIHHAAFDIGVLGVRPDTLRIHVRRDVLDEVDGPMLRHGLQALEGERILLPTRVAQHPDPVLLQWKWDRYLDAG